MADEIRPDFEAYGIRLVRAGWGAPEAIAYEAYGVQGEPLGVAYTPAEEPADLARACARIAAWAERQGVLRA